MKSNMLALIFTTCIVTILFVFVSYYLWVEIKPLKPINCKEKERTQPGRVMVIGLPEMVLSLLVFLLLHIIT